MSSLSYYDRERVVNNVNAGLYEANSGNSEKSIEYFSIAIDIDHTIPVYWFSGKRRESENFIWLKLPEINTGMNSN